MLWSFAYLVVRNLFALVWLLGRPRRSKELEILLLRHELAMLLPRVASDMTDNVTAHAPPVPGDRNRNSGTR